MATFVGDSDRRFSDCMTVEELISELRQMNPEAKVIFKIGYGDRGNTKQAIPVTAVDELDETEAVVETAYSQSEMAIETVDEDDADKYQEFGDDMNFVVLSF